MKAMVWLLISFLSGILFSQVDTTFSELRGMEDARANTHLFYRKHSFWQGARGYVERHTAAPIFQLISLSPLDDHVLFSVDLYSNLFKSNDGGANYMLVDSSASWQLSNIIYDADSLHMYALENIPDGQVLMRSANGGESWQSFCPGLLRLKLRFTTLPDNASRCWKMPGFSYRGI